MRPGGKPEAWACGAWQGLRVALQGAQLLLGLVMNLTR